MTMFHATCDRPRPARAPSCATPRWALVASILASALTFLDGSIVNVALPTLGQAFGGSATDLQWAINAYLLPLSALLLLGGAAGDKFGYRRMLLWSTGAFALASIGCGLAGSFRVFLAMRTLQGVSGAILMPNSLALLGAAFADKGRGKAIGTWSSASVFVSAVGPALGGVLIQTVGWRWIFLINAPVAAIALWVISRTTEAETSERTLDVTGTGLATLGLGLMTLGVSIIAAQRAVTILPLAETIAGLAVLAAFAAWERSRGEAAMMPTAMFGSRCFVGLTVVTFLVFGSLGGFFLLLPYVMIEQGYSPMATGLGLLPFPLVTGLIAGPIGQLAGHIGARTPIAVGCALSAVGYALLLRLDEGSGYLTTIAPGGVLIALGTAGVVAPLTTAVLAAVDARHIGTASGVNSAVSRVGSLIATALIGAVFAGGGVALVASFHVATLVLAGLLAVATLITLATVDVCGADLRLAVQKVPG